MKLLLFFVAFIKLGLGGLPTPGICPGTFPTSEGDYFYYYYTPTSGISGNNYGEICQSATTTRNGVTYVGAYSGQTAFSEALNLSTCFNFTLSGVGGPWFSSPTPYQTVPASCKSLVSISGGVTSTTIKDCNALGPYFVCFWSSQMVTCPTTTSGYFLLETSSSPAGQPFGSTECTKFGSSGSIGSLATTFPDGDIVSIASQCNIGVVWGSSVGGGNCNYLPSGGFGFTSITPCTALLNAAYVCVLSPLQLSASTQSGPAGTVTVTTFFTNEVITTSKTTTTGTFTVTTTTTVLTVTTTTETSTRILTSLSQIFTTTTTSTTFSTTYSVRTTITSKVTLTEKDTIVSETTSTSTSVDLDSDTTTITFLKTRTSCPPSPTTITQTFTIVEGSTTTTFLVTTTYETFTETIDNRTTPSTSTVTRYKCSTSTVELTNTSVVFKACPKCGLCKEFDNRMVKSCRNSDLAVAFAPVAYPHRSCACQAIGAQVMRVNVPSPQVYALVRTCIGETARVWVENGQRLTDCYFLDVEAGQPDIFVKANNCNYVFPVLCTFDY